MLVTIEIHDSYVNGDEFTRTEAVNVDPPLVGVGIDDWGDNAFFGFTGQGGQYIDIDSTHEVKVLECVEQPDLVGKTFPYG
ncbi:hypothetical protein ABIE52_006877 [Rhodococcus sp. OAS809]|uniref:hypothetical protein n=1 Tax=Rhodococcus sp. OAS809 TaxID=2663874 RepID=UPI001789C5D9